MAFNAKNLEYNKQEPAFLRKLRGEFGGLDGRHNIQIARPKKDRLKTGDDDDDPVILDEQGERVDKAEFERRMKEDEVEKELAGEVNGEGEPEAQGEAERQKATERQRVTEIGAATGPKKRKAVKVVGEYGEDGEGDSNENHSDDNSGSHSKQVAHKKAEESEAKPTKKKDSVTAKKKAKKIKLSFDDPDG
ncbi:hypothetical protein A1O1_09231 [Capronia coronata CBS 617.96]|uniref:DUF4604 domain-containing protein n=1 Tax=Capronia coronata CBS 617.96 TaxID=1182541 RepID=W9Y8Y0_9EURO|nr:uncharacterized protein A1O1_09231 [Capronia coronata CBS 617.96]EXJ78829.1 hypothetical protein A1O1_09231 [Capronia coronata CBS 617.96]